MIKWLKNLISECLAETDKIETETVEVTALESTEEAFPQAELAVESEVLAEPEMPAKVSKKKVAKKSKKTTKKVTKKSRKSTK